MDSMAKLVAEKNNLKKIRLKILLEGDKWKVSIMKELALVRKWQIELDIEEKNLADILEAIYTS